MVKIKVNDTTSETDDNCYYKCKSQIPRCTRNDKSETILLAVTNDIESNDNNKHSITIGVTAKSPIRG